MVDGVMAKHNAAQHPVSLYETTSWKPGIVKTPSGKPLVDHGVGPYGGKKHKPGANTPISTAPAPVTAIYELLQTHQGKHK